MFANIRHFTDCQGKSYIHPGCHAVFMAIMAALMANIDLRVFFLVYFSSIEEKVFWLKSWKMATGICLVSN